MFMYHSITVNDDQHDVTVYVYLFIASQLYMFWAMSSPIIRSTWLYVQLLIISTDIAAGWCHGWHQLAAISVENIRSCKYSQVLLMMGEYIAQNM